VPMHFERLDSEVRFLLNLIQLHSPPLTAIRSPQDPRLCK
jgi:hypothetical protein